MATVDEKVESVVEYLEGLQAIYMVMENAYRNIDQEITADVYDLVISDLDDAIAVVRKINQEED